MSKMIPNRPSAEGRQLGEQLARIADCAESAVRRQFPNHARRCASCAFSAGTVPNGCAPTVMDATKCLVESVPFMCHQKFDECGEPTELCAGWAIASTAIDDRLRAVLAPAAARWQFSHLDDEEVQS
ncbi:hypothetical protein K6L27_05185 [Burkholderia cenocepacia]|uniref:hypothetical protein n=1 Tax=Burkholderia cenocepacia TaxID=95486 RepID=UPI00222F6117|nr:hypothetical protein [Burkholderia cenocepacia]MCW3657561.1 hypothetical protein [Burkholderia cenocepacia]